MKIIEIIMLLKLSMQQLVSAEIGKYKVKQIFYLAICDFAMPGAEINKQVSYHRYRVSS